MFITPDDSLLSYEGRIDFFEKERPLFVYAGSNVRFRFKGSRLYVRLVNRQQYINNTLGVIVDGIHKSFVIHDENNPVFQNREQTIKLFDAEEDGDPAEEHEILVYKRQDACHIFWLLGFELEGEEEGLLPNNIEDKKIKLEFYGDSVTSGEVNEALDYIAKEDTDHIKNGLFSDSYYSYSWLTARKLNAEFNIVAQGGIALLDDTGWFEGPDYKGIFNMYDRYAFNTYCGVTRRFEFDSYMPDVVVIAIGQNDSHPMDFMKEDYDGEMAKLWRASYAYLIKLLRKRRPNAHIICMTTLLMHDEAWDRAIGEVVSELGTKDYKIHQYMFRRNGKATPGHPRIPEHEEMANELFAYIREIMADKNDL